MGRGAHLPGCSEGRTEVNLTLTRSQYESDGIFGTLVAGDTRMAVTLEHAYDDGAGNWYAKIPEGTYTCVRGQHQLAHGGPFETFEVTGVPGHTGLLIHWGNWDRDSEGCILVGAAKVGSAITDSRTTFGWLMALQAGVDQFHLEVRRETAS